MRFDLDLDLAPTLVDQLRIRILFFVTRIEILELGEILTLVEQLVQRRRILTGAIPATTVALAILLDPVPGLFGDVLNLENADEAVLRGVDFLPETRISTDAGLEFVAVELVDERVGHHFGG